VNFYWSEKIFGSSPIVKFQLVLLGTVFTSHGLMAIVFRIYGIIMSRAIEKLLVIWFRNNNFNSIINVKAIRVLKAIE